jgi:hypothetical protein
MLQHVLVVTHLCCNMLHVVASCFNTFFPTCLLLQHAQVATHIICYNTPYVATHILFQHACAYCCNISLVVICLMLQHASDVANLLLQHVTHSRDIKLCSHILFSSKTLNPRRTRALILLIEDHKFQHSLPQTRATCTAIS